MLINRHGRAPRARAAMTRRGFTLVELLVVVAIVALLLGILLPALARARATAKQTACQHQMRQLGQALQMYADDHSGFFPLTSHTVGMRFDRAWIFTLARYLGDVDDVRICPEDPKGPARLDRHGTSYVMNGYLAVPGEGSIFRLTDLKYPSTTITTFEVSDSVGASVMNDHTHSHNWFREPAGVWQRITSDIQPDRHNQRSETDDHTDGSANYLYADTHVDAISAEELKRKADDFVNFALPEQ
jgi:prepilin-type N-terminal cleavage/methylation domain-containing protein/prepilin-type processing-associated H-X9-DG protein